MLNRIRKARADESGSTFIELLIIIVVTGVLAVIVVFAVSAFNNDGKVAACHADKKNIKIAVTAYYARNASKWPASIDALVTAKYLKEAPLTTDGYQIVLDSSTGIVRSTGLTGC